MSAVETFELRRQIDGLVYRFHRDTIPDGELGYRREDRELWILWTEDRGWISVLPETGALSGRPWEITPGAQSAESPPEGIWVSRKGEKSYVYDLVYV